jgi:hypothetical protein
MNFLVNTYRRPHPKELRSGQSEQPWSNDSLKRRPDVRHARNRARTALVPPPAGTSPAHRPHGIRLHPVIFFPFPWWGW